MVTVEARDSAPRRDGATGSAFRGSSRTDRRGPEQLRSATFLFRCDVNQVAPHAYQHPVLPCGIDIGGPAVAAGACVRSFGHRGRGAGPGTGRGSDCARLAGRFRVLDPGENAVGQAGDADGAGNAAERLLDIRPERPEWRCAGPRPDGSAPIPRGSNRNTGQPPSVAADNGRTAGYSTPRRCGDDHRSLARGPMRVAKDLEFGCSPCRLRCRAHTSERSARPCGSR